MIEKKKISAKVIADSVNSKGDRITSFILTFPRFILSELNTHRAFSRNSASSRAIPFYKNAKMVEEDPFIPIAWMKDHKGMQGSDFIEEENSGIVKNCWLRAKSYAIKEAIQLSQLGVSKQICNRLLEPFMWHTAIVTATDFENFFYLRANKDAEIHFQKLAFEILESLRNSIPKKLKDGQWHIPFGDIFDKNRLNDIVLNSKEYISYPILLNHSALDDLMIRICIARCARVSYLNFEGKDDYISDLKLFESLKNSGHMSPFEHCAMADSNLGYCGNFKGFKQIRKFIENENKTYKI